MFSRAAEKVLNSAAREAVTRRHAHLTLEHLLFAILSEPSGEKILRAAGADTARLKAELETVLSDTLDTLPAGARRQPEQTLAFRRALQTAVLHVQSAGKTEAEVGDILAAILQQSRSHAVDLLAAHGVTRLDVLNYISHGVSKTPLRDEEDEGDAAAGGVGSARWRSCAAAARTTPSSSATPAWARPPSWRDWPRGCSPPTPPRC